MSSKKLIKVWEKASLDLGIKIQSPFNYKDNNGREFTFDLLIENFGSQFGTIVFTLNNMTDFNTVKEYVFYCSALNPKYYNEYKTKNFIETLNDWGYYGKPQNRPEWYQGEIYK